MQKALTEYKGILIGIILALIVQAVYESLNSAYGNNGIIPTWVMPYLTVLLILSLISVAYGIIKLSNNQKLEDKKRFEEFAKLTIKNVGKELEVLGMDAETVDKILKSWRENISPESSNEN
jgi:hypothetical protein